MTYAEYTDRRIAHETSMEALFQAEKAYADFEKACGEQPTWDQIQEIWDYAAKVDQAVENLLANPVDYIDTETSRLQTYRAWAKHFRKEVQNS